MKPILVKRASKEINFEWDKGSTFRYKFLWTSGKDEINQSPVSLSGAEARADFRDEQGNLLHRLSTDSGTIDLDNDGIEGQIQMYISAADLASFTWEFSRYDMDIFFQNGDTRKLIHGTFRLFEESTV